MQRVSEMQDRAEWSLRAADLANSQLQIEMATAEDTAGNGKESGIMAEKQKRQSGVLAKVYNAVHQYEGKQFDINEIKAMTQLTDSQVRNAVASLISRKGMPIVPLIRGTVWKYEVPDGPPSAPLFEQVGMTKNGSVILESESGDLWIAKRVD